MIPLTVRQNAYRINPPGTIPTPTGKTAEAFIFELCEYAPWQAAWWRLHQIALSVPAGSKHMYRDKAGQLRTEWSTYNSEFNLPPDLLALGCQGVNVNRSLAWVLFDLDVGHGDAKKKYETRDEAIKAAHKIRDYYNECAEIRLSKGGSGVHVCHLQPDDTRPASDRLKLAKFVVEKLGIRACPSPLARQVRWLWTGTPRPDSFKLIAKHRGLRYEQ